MFDRADSYIQTHPHTHTHTHTTLTQHNNSYNTKKKKKKLQENKNALNWMGKSEIVFGYLVLYVTKTKRVEDYWTEEDSIFL